MHQKEVTHSDGTYEEKSRRWTWLTKWDKEKIPWYTHRLMHRKRVTSELHDSYFRLMTIKHAIQRIEWAIEWVLNYYITQSRQKSELDIRRVRRQYVVEKPGGRGPWDPDELETREKLLIRCSKESQHSAESWDPGPLVEHRENEKDTTLTAIRVGVNILQFLFGLQLRPTIKPWITFSNPYNKVRGTYFSKEVFARRYSLRQYVSCMSIYMSIQHKECVWMPRNTSERKEREQKQRAYSM